MDKIINLLRLSEFKEKIISLIPTKVSELDNDLKYVTQTDVEDLKKSVSDGKELVADAITEKGVETAADATFATMSENIGQIETGNAVPPMLVIDVFSLGGYTAETTVAGSAIIELDVSNRGSIGINKVTKNNGGTWLLYAWTTEGTQQNITPSITNNIAIALKNYVKIKIVLKRPVGKSNSSVKIEGIFLQ